jgi:YggT family protein
MNIITIGTWSLGLFFALMTILFLLRIILTWYPDVKLTELPYSLAYLPTEPFLAPTRKIIPPLGGVDITPVVWLGIFTLLREMLLGQQGIITMALNNG